MFTIVAGILITLFVAPIVLILALIFIRFNPGPRYLLIATLIATVAADAALLIFHPQIHTYARSKWAEAVEAQKTADAEANQLSELTDCAENALDANMLDKCYANLPVELHDKLREAIAEIPDSALAPPPVDTRTTVDCTKITAAIEKTICNTPELKALNEKLKTLYANAKVQKQGDWQLQFQEMLRCRTSEICIQKSYEDQIYRMTH